MWDHRSPESGTPLSRNLINLKLISGIRRCNLVWLVYGRLEKLCEHQPVWTQQFFTRCNVICSEDLMTLIKFIKLIRLRKSGVSGFGQPMCYSNLKIVLIETNFFISVRGKPKLLYDYNSSGHFKQPCADHPWVGCSTNKKEGGIVEKYPTGWWESHEPEERERDLAQGGCLLAITAATFQPTNIRLSCNGVATWRVCHRLTSYALYG